MIEKIRDDVVKIVGDSNVYVILGESPIVIDTSDSHHAKWIREQLEGVVDLDSVKTVLLTHLHYDHVGNLDFFPNATVYASSDDLRSYREDPGNFFLYDISETVHMMLRSAKVLPPEIFGLEVISAPGHTPGSVAFLDNSRRILFSGDTLFFNGVGRTDFKNSLPHMMDSSVQKLASLVRKNDLTLCPGHDY